jgi:ABC-type Fe3+ transport system substrate-binding protein
MKTSDRRQAKGESRKDFSCRRVVLFACCLLCFAVFACAAHAAFSPADWERTVHAAQKEGELVLYASDLFGPIFNLLLPAKALDARTPALILPEVLDESKWWQGKHHYGDLEKKFIFIYEGSAQSGGISYNTLLVNPKEMTSYWDLLRPRRRGKIISTDPRRPGTSMQNLRFYYHHPELGADFLKRLYGEMDVAISRDDQQMIDWLAAGKCTFALFVRGRVEDEKKKGLPVDEFYPGSFKEGALVDSTRGALTFLNRAPHPNATRLAINWFLSREGQRVYQKVFAEGGTSGGNSMREDIPKDEVRPDVQRSQGVKFLFTGLPEWIEMKPIHALLQKTLAEAKKN